MIIIIIIIILISYTFRLIWLCVLVFLVSIYFTKKKKKDEVGEQYAIKNILPN